MPAKYEAMRSRCTLARTQLERFKIFCEAMGWAEVPTKGVFEVLRMRHAEQKEPLIVHQKMGTFAHSGHTPTVHLTTWGQSAVVVKQFLRAKRTQI
jgi:hypothetical protein